MFTKRPVSRSKQFKIKKETLASKIVTSLESEMTLQKASEHKPSSQLYQSTSNGNDFKALKDTTQQKAAKKEDSGFKPVKRNEIVLTKS